MFNTRDIATCIQRKDNFLQSFKLSYKEFSFIIKSTLYVLIDNNITAKHLFTLVHVQLCDYIYCICKFEEEFSINNKEQQLNLLRNPNFK